MKSFFTLITGFCFLIASSGNVFGGDDKKAKAILDELSKNTRSYTSIVSEYTRTVVNKDKKQVENQKGKVKIKGKKYRVELPGLLIVTDGATLWSHQQEGDLSIRDYDKNSELNPDNLFFIYEKGYTYSLEKTVKDGNNTSYVINLVPQKKKNIETVKLYVDGSKKKILKAEVFKTNKSVETIQITNFIVNSTIADTEFKIDETKFSPDQVLDERTN